MEESTNCVIQVIKNIDVAKDYPEDGDSPPPAKESVILPWPGYRHEIIYKLAELIAKT